jgi:hypothetical protein
MRGISWIAENQLDSQERLWLHGMGRTQNCWILNLVVHKVTTGLYRLESINRAGLSLYGLQTTYRYRCPCPRHENVQGEIRYNPLILKLVTRWSWGVKFTPLPLYPRERTSRARWREGWISPQAGMEVLGSEKISCTYRGSNSGSSSK